MAEETPTKHSGETGQATACFISYRRSTIAPLARAIFEYLDARKVQANLDLEFIGAGDFRDAIRERICNSPYLLPVLTPKTLQRCSEPEDVLLFEYETALVYSENIVPLISQRFNRRDIKRYLPTQVAEVFNSVNSLTIDLEHFRPCMEVLLNKFLRPEARLVGVR